MLVIYTIAQFSQSLKAKLQKLDHKGRFAKPLPKPSDVTTATSTHITGLEMTKGENGKTQYKFKKFLQPKVSEFKVQKFNPDSMS